MALLSYYENNKQRMPYGTYRRKGYLVGSGSIESANRNIIQKRLKLSGQRWTEQGAQHMACLRAFIRSMRLDALHQLLKTAKLDFCLTLLPKGKDERNQNFS
ncbi:MAG TPA: hypothetical protein VHA52_00085 [Candidatus Babeliaceae bacterium]|nr:hypothetical protein [Candidatus Babeliaceae bacterium]